MFAVTLWTVVGTVADASISTEGSVIAVVVVRLAHSFTVEHVRRGDALRKKAIHQIAHTARQVALLLRHRTAQIRRDQVLKRKFNFVLSTPQKLIGFQY